MYNSLRNELPFERNNMGGDGKFSGYLMKGQFCMSSNPINSKFNRSSFINLSYETPKGTLPEKSTQSSRV